MTWFSEKSLFPLGAYVVSCPSCTKNLKWYVICTYVLPKHLIIHIWKSGTHWVIIVFEVTLQVVLWQKDFFFHHLIQNRTPDFSGICQNRTQISTNCFKILTPPGKVKLLCPFSFQILNTKIKSSLQLREY